MAERAIKGRSKSQVKREAKAWLKAQGGKKKGGVLEFRFCRVCNDPGPIRCAICGVARYCSRECQIADWDVHKTQCEDLKASGPWSFSGIGTEPIDHEALENVMETVMEAFEDELAAASED